MGGVWVAGVAYLGGGSELTRGWSRTRSLPAERAGCDLAALAAIWTVLQPEKMRVSFLFDA